MTSALVTAPKTPHPVIHHAMDAIKRFLSNIMHLTPRSTDIFEAEQLGKGYTRWVRGRDINFPPPVRVRCSETFAAKVMNNAGSLAGKADESEGFKYYVKRSLPEAQRAIRDRRAGEVRQYKIDNAKAKTEADKTTFHFENTRFIVNGQVVEEDISPPSYLDMLYMDDETTEAVHWLEFYSSLPKTIKKSSFQAYATTPASKHDVELAYMKVCMMNRQEDHIMVVCRMKDGDQILQGSASDREHYGDQEILTAILKAKAINIAVFVVREYGGIPLRGLRFEAIKEVTNEVLHLSEHEVLPPSPAKQPNQNATPKKQREPKHRPYKAPQGGTGRRFFSYSARGGHGRGSGGGKRGQFSTTYCDALRGSDANDQDSDSGSESESSMD